VDGLDVSALIDEEQKEIGLLRAQIDHQVFLFRTGSSRLLPGQKDKLNDLIPTIHELITLATAARKDPRLHLTGHTDSQGIEKTNLALSMSRAARVSSLLAASGIDQDLIISAGVGAKKPLRAEKDEADRIFNRSVSIKVSLKNPPQNERSK
jgi:OmpA-OmpF porin, OOP family